jgi:hypothetical protein
MKFEGIVTLKSSLSHIGESIGNQSLLRREKVIQPDLSIAEVVVYSGNALRGALRDCGVIYFMQKLGIEKLSFDGFYLLFSGGALTATGRGMDLDLARKMRKLIPLLSVFGGAVGNQIMEGKLIVGKLYPLCEECRRQIPERYHHRIKTSFRLWLQEEEYTRSDDGKSETLRPYILESSIPAKHAPQQMRYAIETLAAGAQFYSTITLMGESNVELGAFLSTLDEFSKYPSLGGKRGTGHGVCEMDYERVRVNANIHYDDEMRTAKAAYDEYLREYQKALFESKDEIQEVLGIESPNLRQT